MLRKQSQCEADEFSFVNEHVLDEPSIHVRTIAHLPTRMQGRDGTRQLPPKKVMEEIVSILMEDTLCEPSAFFDENVCNTTILHKAHMVEQYAIPAKRHIQNSETDRQTQRLNALINQVKQDVTLNQSKIGRSKCTVSLTHDESEMPNVSNEELHISNMVTKVPQNGGPQQPQSELHKLHLL